jgi:geranylgeranyl diphosphate synthase type II
MDRFAETYFEACRGPVFAEVDRIIRNWTSADQYTYGLMTDYVARKAKGLRPGLCIAVCRALGGSLEEVAPSAAVVELFHNAFLIHDDIEDGSEERRGSPALHQTHGTSIALNIGDGLLALALRPLLDNTQRLGLSRTLQILEIVVHMVTESFEGQAMELRWIDEGDWALDEYDYEQMVRKKTCCYSFVSPAEIGAVVAKADLSIRQKFKQFMYSLGLAFQIQDDLLNLSDDNVAYGKELNGDLWEGKRTLMLLHSIRGSTESEKNRAIEILNRQRPQSNVSTESSYQVETFMDQLYTNGVIDEETRRRITEFSRESLQHPAVREKTTADIEFLKSLIDKYDGIQHARNIASAHANDATQIWQTISLDLDESIHTNFIAGLTDFVVSRKC